MVSGDEEFGPEMWKSHWCIRCPKPRSFPRCELSAKAQKLRRQILSWKSDPSTPFLCIPGWERSVRDETEGTHKMWFKVATEGVSVTSPCPLRPRQAGFLIRAVGRGSSWLLLQCQGKPYLRSLGPLTLDPLSLSSTDLTGQNMSFRWKRYFWTWELICFLPGKAHLKQPLTVFLHSAVSVKGLFYQIGCMILVKEQISEGLRCFCQNFSSEKTEDDIRRQLPKHSFIRTLGQGHSTPHPPGFGGVEHD